MRVCPRCRSIYSVAVERCGIDGAAIVEQNEDPLVGSDVDRFKVLAPIGKGAMGCVYRAKHNVLPTEFAIKVLYGNFAVNQRLIERFKREAQAIANMSHANVVKVHDFGTTEAGLTFLVMELVDGHTLEKSISTDAPFPPQRVAQIARQIASGLGEAHRRGFVHRDMKPANIMLKNNDGIDVVKILDFGVVGMMQAAAAAKLTAAGHIVGTPSYMAPEQARTSTVTQAADLYALGCIMYEMLEGHPPFEGLGVAEVLLKHINEKPRPLGEARGLERIAMWLLEKDPEKRPPSAIRVIAELDRLSLGTANTEQILVSRVKSAMESSLDAETERHDQQALSEFDRTAPVALFQDPAERSGPTPLDPFDKSEHDTADLPVSRISDDAKKDPSDENAPRLIAPAMSVPPLAPPPGMSSPVAKNGGRNVLETETEVDIRLAMKEAAKRPVFDRTQPPMSNSARDTEKPIEPAADSHTPREDLNRAALLAMMHSETVRDTPSKTKSVASAASNRLWYVILAALIAIGVGLAAMAWK